MELQVNRVKPITPNHDAAPAVGGSTSKVIGEDSTSSILSMQGKGNETVISGKTVGVVEGLNPVRKGKGVEGEGTQGNRDWIGLFDASKQAAKGMNLSYVPL